LLEALALAPLLAPPNALPDEAERLAEGLALDCEALGDAVDRFAPPPQVEVVPAPVPPVEGRVAAVPVEGRAEAVPVAGRAPALAVEGEAPPEL
jgi:hypothetical protein